MNTYNNNNRNNNINNNTTNNLQNEINRLRSLKFRELKNMLAYEKNPNRRLLIKQIMLEKYNRIKQKMVKNFIHDVDIEDTNNKFPIDAGHDITEYERDMVNNNLIARLNTDIDIKKKNKNKKPVVISPYSNTAGSNYAPYKSDDHIPKNDFSNPKLHK